MFFSLAGLVVADVLTPRVLLALFEASAGGSRTDTGVGLPGGLAIRLIRLVLMSLGFIEISSREVKKERRKEG